jgi:hypothetical protein
MVMSFHRAKVSLVTFGLFVLTCFVPAGPPKKDDPAAKDKEVVDSKVVHQPAAASIKFRKELKLPLATLNTLGSRIDAARRSSDSLALVHAANELAMAEKVSGKKASLTSALLAKEAADLASLRRKNKEMEAVLAMSQKLEAEQQSLTTLRQAIDIEKQRAKEEKEAIERNEEPTWTPRQVVVNNYTTQYLDVYVNGHYKMQVVPGGRQICVIEHRWNPTVLKAYGDEDTDTWGPRYIWGRFKKYTWSIN